MNDNPLGHQWLIQDGFPSLLNCVPKTSTDWGLCKINDCIHSNNDTAALPCGTTVEHTLTCNCTSPQELRRSMRGAEVTGSRCNEGGSTRTSHLTSSVLLNAALSSYRHTLLLLYYVTSLWCVWQLLTECHCWLVHCLLMFYEAEPETYPKNPLSSDTCGVTLNDSFSGKLELKVNFPNVCEPESWK